MTFKSAVKTAALLAAVLLAVPAFAQGTATYLGTHTASDAQIDGADFLDFGAGFGPSTVTYTGTLIQLDTIVATDFSGVQLPDDLGNPVELNGDGTVTLEIDSVSFTDTTANTDFLGFYFDETGVATSQVYTAITPDGSGGFNMGIGGFGGGAPDTVNNQAAITFPATVVITRAGADMTLTINSIPLPSETMSDAAVSHFPRVFFSGVGGDMSISYTSIEVTGVGTADVNQAPVATGPTATITRDQVVDWAFTNGSGSWTVQFTENVINVDTGDFSLTTLGPVNVGSLTVEGADDTYTAQINTVTGTGTIGLNFNVGNVVAEGDGTPALAANSGSQWFTNVVPAPAATGWVLVFLGVVLFLAATVVIRRKALKH